MFFYTPLVATLLRLVFDTAALRPLTTGRHFGSHPLSAWKLTRHHRP